MKNTTVYLIISAVVMSALFILLMVGTTRDKAVQLEEAVETAKSNIQIQEKKRIDLVYNLVDCVKQYDSHESEVLNNIANSRNKYGDMENISASIIAVAEAYPELKSNEQYKTLMMELTTLENEISQCRTAYNMAVERYNRYIRQFLSETFLEWVGYEKRNYDRLYYDMPIDTPQDLFGE